MVEMSLSRLGSDVVVASVERRYACGAGVVPSGFCAYPANGLKKYVSK
jgi:hypothetical protein